MKAFLQGRALELDFELEELDPTEPQPFTEQVNSKYAVFNEESYAGVHVYGRPTRGVRVKPLSEEKIDAFISVTGDDTDLSGFEYQEELAGELISGLEELENEYYSINVNDRAAWISLKQFNG